MSQYLRRVERDPEEERGQGAGERGSKSWTIQPPIVLQPVNIDDVTRFNLFYVKKKKHFSENTKYIITRLF